MRKIEFTVGLTALMFTCLLFTACQKAKEPEGRQEALQKEETSQKASVKKDFESAQAPKVEEKPARCGEIWAKKPKFTKGEKKYLWETCRIPWADTPKELSSVLKWWKDEDGNEVVMADNFWHRTREQWDEISETDALQHIALNSKFPALRHLSVSALHQIDKKKFIPLFKEVLRKEVEERGVTNETRGSEGVVLWTGRFLSDEGEYEYAFLYLMKAKIFEISADKKDLKAVVYAKEALNDRDDGIKLDAADAIQKIATKDEDRALAFKAAVSVLKTSKDGAYRNTAVYVLRELKDMRAIPILEGQLKIEQGYKKDDILKALQILKGTESKEMR